jgi:hypothetical protein
VCVSVHLFCHDQHSKVFLILWQECGGLGPPQWGSGVSPRGGSGVSPRGARGLPGADRSRDCRTSPSPPKSAGKNSRRVTPSHQISICILI